jgi:hypothetical protein
MEEPMPAARTLTLVMTLAAAPLAAQETKPVPLPEEDGFSLMEEGARLVLRGLMSEMEPALNELEGAWVEIQPALRDLGPRFQELVTMMGDVTNYAAPEMLPNGDIILRRKTPLPPVETAPAPDGAIDL